MKKKILLTIILLSFPIILLSQTLNVHKNDGTVFQMEISAIDSITFTTQSITTCPQTVTYEGKTYNTVQIGDQCWLKENLDVGTMIDSLQNASENGVIEKYCYRNDTNNCTIYGGLYQWNEAMQYVITAGTQGICPSGWHIPTGTEISTLENSVGSNGNALKAIGQGIDEGAGTNTSGFSGLLAGFYNGDNSNFFFLGRYAYIWSSVGEIPNNPYKLRLWYDHADINFNSTNKSNGFSVRCLKD